MTTTSVRLTLAFALALFGTAAFAQSDRAAPKNTCEGLATATRICMVASSPTL